MSKAADLALDGFLGAVAPQRESSGVDGRARKARFERLVNEHAATALALARRLLPTAEDAEDAVQETFLKAWRGLPRFRAEAKVSSWVYRILVNTCRDRLRRTLRQAGPRDAAHPTDPSRAAAGRDLVARVLSAVEGLPRRQRECLLLRVRAELTYREIGEVLGISAGVVKLHLVAARKSLVLRFGREVTP